jgi:hypothetical protein
MPDSGEGKENTDTASIKSMQRTLEYTEKSHKS